MTTYFTRAHYQQSADFIRHRTQHTPKFGLILGSGLGGLADSIENANRIPSTDIPHWPHSTVEGHAGQLVIGKLRGQTVLAQQGRVHFYEGLPMQHITLPVRVMFELGVRYLIVTNAAGGINPTFNPGDVMLIEDHINLVGMAGFNPLIGPNDSDLGPRFPDMSNAYDRDLRGVAMRAAADSGITLRQGVYCQLAGPSFETPADIRFLKAIGADAVGMSTVPETTVARHCGMKVLGFSGISNVHRLDGSPTTHEEVLETGKAIGPKLAAIITGVLSKLAEQGIGVDI
ncbi:MAG: purine-nucleoside phosphorylase [Chloroflexi bacterium]|nr:purine-nucleoside phosphorylase [Chloroflexota bacterium]